MSHRSVDETTDGWVRANRARGVGATALKRNAQGRKAAGHPLQLFERHTQTPKRLQRPVDGVLHALAVHNGQHLNRFAGLGKHVLPSLGRPAVMTQHQRPTDVGVIDQLRDNPVLQAGVWGLQAALELAVYGQHRLLLFAAKALRGNHGDPIAECHGRHHSQVIAHTHPVTASGIPGKGQLSLICSYGYGHGLPLGCLGWQCR